MAKTTHYLLVFAFIAYQNMCQSKFIPHLMCEEQVKWCIKFFCSICCGIQNKIFSYLFYCHHTRKTKTIQLWTKINYLQCFDGTRLSPGACCPGAKEGTGWAVGCRRYSRTGSECTYTECSPQYKLKIPLSMAQRSKLSTSAAQTQYSIFIFAFWFLYQLLLFCLCLCLADKIKVFWSLPTF